MMRNLSTVFCFLCACSGASVPAIDREVDVVRPASSAEVTVDGCVPIIEPCEEMSDDPAICGAWPECFYGGTRYGRRCGGKSGYTTWGVCVPAGGR